MESEKIIQELKAENSKLKEAYKTIEGEYANYIMSNSIDIQLWSALEYVLREKGFSPVFQTEDLNVTNPIDKSRLKINVNALDLVCIYTPDKGRKKIIYVMETNSKKERVLREYNYNNNENTNETLRKLFDPLEHCLVNVSRNAVVNAMFYRSEGKKILKDPQLEKTSAPEVEISSKSRLRTFKFVKRHLEYSNSLHVRANDYMISNFNVSHDNFTLQKQLAMSKKPNHNADIKNPNKGSNGTNVTYDKNQGNRGKQIQQNQKRK